MNVECLLTQLLFEHSLRIRVKAEASSSDNQQNASASATTTEPTTPDSASVAGTQEASEADTLIHSQGNTEPTIAPSVTTGKQDKDKSDPKSKEGSSSSAENLVGKINNLVTSDLDNINGGRDFLFVGM